MVGAEGCAGAKRGWACIGLALDYSIQKLHRGGRGLGVAKRDWACSGLALDYSHY